MMADEAKNGNTEQLAVCVRYVFQECIRERFLCLRRLGGYDAESITNALEEVLGSHGSDGLKVVAQSYDGAAVMSGSVRGVQTRFREKHPEAIYVHCYAHELNLVLCHTCKAIPEASFFFDMLESLYSCFSTSIKSHDQLVAVQKELNIERRELVQISSTRSTRSCQVNSINALLRNFPAVIRSLQMLNTPIAVGLLSKLSKRTTVYLLVVFQRLLGIKEGFHRFLQGTSIDLARAVQFNSSIHDTLVSQRTEQVAEELYEVTKQLCSDHNTTFPSPLLLQGESRGEWMILLWRRLLGRALTCLTTQSV